MPWKVIEFQDETGQIMVARVPPQGTAELVSGTQLIVQDGQIAAFFHDGKPADGFRAGRHTISTQNLPVLGKLLNIAALGKSPFRSYVYFVALKTFIDLGWGTPAPVMFRDSEFRIVNLRANGAFALRIRDPRTFLRTIVGTQGIETSFAVEGYLRKIIVSKLTQILPTVMSTVLDLPVKYDELAAKVKQAVYEQFDQYGLELVDFVVESVTVPPEVQEAINRAAGTRAVGRDELGHYERVMRSEALRDSAKQPGSAAGAGLAAGLGAGAGINIAKDMLNQSAARTDAAPPAKLSMDQIRANLKELKQLVDEGLITQEDFESKKKQLLDQV
jgi:membrane protease subunit (stomatin/prohibitin family)